MVALMTMVAITIMAMEMMAMMTEWEMGEVRSKSVIVLLFSHEASLNFKADKMSCLLFEEMNKVLAKVSTKIRLCRNRRVGLNF